MPRPGRRAFRLALGALVTLVLSCSLGAAASGGQTGPAVIRLTDVQLSTASYAAKGRAGSVQIIEQRLFGSGSPRKVIGHSFVRCMYVTSHERTCDGSYLLPRGMLLTSGVLQSRLFYTVAITGGTGLYDNARGTLTVTAQKLKPRRELLIFRLTG
jgi:hypothetical protein